MVVLGLVAAAALALSLTGSMSAFTQAFLHGTNTVKTPSISMVESNSTGETVTCDGTNGTATCTTPDLYGAETLRPGQSSTPQTVTFANRGTLKPTSFRVTGGPCAVTPNSGASLCDQLVVKMTWRGSSITGSTITASSLAAGGYDIPDAPDGGAHSTLTVQVTLPANASQDTSGVTLSQPLTFTFTA